MDDRLTAWMLVQAVTSAIDGGLEHYDIRGKRLTTTSQVLAALERDGEIRLVNPDAGPPDA
jgi:hypothetical protein